MKNLLRRVGVALTLALASAPAARANLVQYYVGLDTGTGTNNGHLTLLKAHGDHFHRLGVFGGAEGRIPEAYIGGSLSLQEGTGAFQGRYVSREYETPGSEVGEYSHLEIRPISSLLGFADGTPEAILANGGLRYFGPLAGTSLALELVSLTPGLHVADQVGNPILSAVGDRHVLGAGDSFAPFMPMFLADTPATVESPYSAAFRLVDVNGIAPESQVFRYDFVTEIQAVPEPSGLALMGLGLGATLLVKMRSRKRSSPVATT